MKDAAVPRGLPLLAALRAPARLGAFSLAEWDLLLRQAAAANLLARLYYLAHQHSALDSIPAPARLHLDWARTAAERHARAARWEVSLIQQALAGLGTPLILLKGAAYAMAALPPAPGRLFSDIDVLVAPEQLGMAEGALILHGWVATHLDAYDQRYYREWMHDCLLYTSPSPRD